MCVRDIAPGLAAPFGSLPADACPALTPPEPASPPEPANAAKALAAVRAGLEYLATVDPSELTTEEQADCIRGLAVSESIHVVATARMLGAFDAADGHARDGQISARQWLKWQTRVTAAAAAAATGWQRRLMAHPAVAGALAGARLSPSWARAICDWTDVLPPEHRAAADEILADAAADCARLGDVRLAFERIRALCARPDSGDDDDRFGQRRLILQPHFQGHARLSGDLTPEAAAALRAALDSLGKRAGPEDVRTRAQREHDALEEICRTVIASGRLPDRAGQPVQIQLNMTLSQLAGRPEADQDIAAWIAARATPAPPGADCDATIVPVVTGSINHDELDQLAAALLATREARSSAADSAAADPGALTAAGSTSGLGRAERAAQQMTIARAVRLLSGPDGLAAWLRARQQTGLAGSVSLPLDIGAPTDTIPSHIRRAVARRDLHCRFPGCSRPAAACHVHHLRPKADGGPTSLANCALLCPFHHLTVIHRWAWKLYLNPDGTTTAISPDGSRAFHSHAPPTAA